MKERIEAYAFTEKGTIIKGTANHFGIFKVGSTSYIDEEAWVAWRPCFPDDRFAAQRLIFVEETIKTSPN